MEKLSKDILELNFFGSSIQKTDRVYPKVCELRDTIELVDQVRPLEEFDLENLLNENIKKRIKNKVPVILLSGGVDSTLLLELASAHSEKVIAATYLMDKNDPAKSLVDHVLANHKNIQHIYVYHNSSEVRKIWDNYFDHFQSPSLDYSGVLMVRLFEGLIQLIDDNEINRQDLIILDGIGADDLFGNSIHRKSHKAKSYVNFVGSKFFINQFKKNLKFNAYSSNISGDLIMGGAYQNFIFSKVLANDFKPQARDYLKSVMIDLKSSDFYKKVTLMYLFYDERRMILKSLSPSIINGIQIYFPFMEKNVITAGISLENDSKIKPSYKPLLKNILRDKGYADGFVNHSKLGFSFDPFQLINRESLNENLLEIGDIIPLRRDANSILNWNLSMINGSYRDSISHFSFGIAMSAAFIKKENQVKSIG